MDHFWNFSSCAKNPSAAYFPPETDQKSAPVSEMYTLSTVTYLRGQDH